MIAFGTAITNPATYAELALPGIERAAEPDSAIVTRRGLPIRDAYDALMDEAGGYPDLEALVLLHQDLELTDGSLPGRLRRLFRDPRVALAGTLGASNLTLHLRIAARTLHGAVSAPGVRRRFSPPGFEEVEALDGALLVLAPWVVRGLRFGRSVAPFHGYDVEFSLRVRAHGGRAACIDVPHFHHHATKPDFAAQGDAAVALARLWDPLLRPPQWAAAFQL